MPYWCILYCTRVWTWDLLAIADSWFLLYIYKFDYLNCPQAVAMVGAHFCSLYNDQQEKKNFLSVITDAKWGIKLGKFGVSWLWFVCTNSLILFFLICLLRIKICPVLFFSQVSIQSVFRQSAESKRNLIPVLVKNRNMTAEILQDYCRWVKLHWTSSLASSPYKHINCLGCLIRVKVLVRSEMVDKNMTCVLQPNIRVQM